MTTEGTTEPIEMVTVSDDNVAVEEELSRRNGGWVISFTLTAKGDSPVAVRISVPMPDEPVRQDVGFHPKHSPESWVLSGGVLTFEDVVSADEPLQILLGIVLADDDDDVTLSLIEPSIELSQPVEPDEEVEAAKEPIFRSSSLSAREDTPSDAQQQMDTGPVEEADSIGTFEDSEGDDHEDWADALEAPAKESPDDSADSEAPVEESPSKDSEASSSIEGIDLDRLSEAVDEADDTFMDDLVSESEGVVDADEAGEDVDSADIFSTSTTQESESEVASPEPESTTQDTGADSEDVLSKLVAQLESSDEGGHEIESLREHLLPESQKATQVRLQHIQSRMDDLAAYTEALEGLINEHGTASDFITDMEEDIDDIRSQVKSLRREVDSAETEREDLRESMDEVESTMEEVGDDLRSRTENIYEELDSMRDSMESRDKELGDLKETVHEHDDQIEAMTGRIESTEDQLEEHRDALDQRLSTLSNQLSDVQQTLETDYGQLREEVESLAHMRETFARAFATQDVGDEFNEFNETEDSGREGEGKTDPSE